MIKSAKIRYFQKHKDLDLQFTPGINVIAGESDQGKSAIIRALRWVLENKPTGNRFRTKKIADTTPTSVILEIDDETITRTKSSSKNEYVFKGETFKAMGSDVPEPILRFTNIKDINIQRQLDEPFLFKYPESKVSKMINEVSGMEEIAQAIDEVNRRVREGNSKESVLIEMIDEKEAEMQHLIKYQKIKPLVDEIQDQIDEVESMQESVDELRKHLKSAKQIKDQKLHKNVADKVYAFYDDLVSFYNSYTEKQNTIQRLNNLINRYRKAHSEPVFDFTEIDKALKVVNDSISKFENKSDLIWRLEKALESLAGLDTEIEANKEKIEAEEQSLVELKKKLGICPVCKKEW